MSSTEASWKPRSAKTAAAVRRNAARASRRSARAERVRLSRRAARWGVAVGIFAIYYRPVGQYARADWNESLGEAQMKTRPILWHIGISHYNEKARWALDL